MSKNAIALIHVFTRYDRLEDLWTPSPEMDKFIQEQIEKTDKAAKQFIAQLEGHWTPRFLKALRKEIDKELKKLDGATEQEPRSKIIPGEDEIYEIVKDVGNKWDGRYSDVEYNRSMTIAKAISKRLGE